MSERLKQIHGIIPPMITPFNEDGKLYEVGLRNLISFLRNRVDGLFICGSYGAGPIMSPEERKRLAEIVMEEVGGKLSVIVHVGAIDPYTTYDLIDHANNLGCDAIASVPPFYFDYSESDVYRYYEQIIRRAKVPVLAYNNPKTTGFSMSPEFIKSLAELGLAGLKDSSHDIAFFYRVMHETRELDFLCLEGSIAMGLPSLIAGSPAIISGLANAFPEIEQQLIKASEAGEWDGLIKTQQYIDAVKNSARLGPQIPVTHAMLNMRGVDVGVPHFPYVPLDNNTYSILKSRLTEFGLL